MKHSASKKPMPAFMKMRFEASAKKFGKGSPKNAHDKMAAAMMKKHHGEMAAADNKPYKTRKKRGG